MHSRLLLRWQMLNPRISCCCWTHRLPLLSASPCQEIQKHLLLVTFSQKSQFIFPVRRFSLSISFLSPLPTVTHQDSKGLSHIPACLAHEQHTPAGKNGAKIHFSWMSGIKSTHRDHWLWRLITQTLSLMTQTCWFLPKPADVHYSRGVWEAKGVN